MVNEKPSLMKNQRGLREFSLTCTESVNRLFNCQTVRIVKVEAQLQLVPSDQSDRLGLNLLANFDLDYIVIPNFASFQLTGLEDTRCAFDLCLIACQSDNSVFRNV